MSSWNYRVLLDDECYSIIEVYYENGSIDGWCGAAALGSTADGLREDLERHLEALDRPILTPADLGADNR